MVYLMRLAAFGLIIAAIVDRNRSGEPARAGARAIGAMRWATPEGAAAI